MGKRTLPKEVKKRDGAIVPFEKEKIRYAMMKLVQRIGHLFVATTDATRLPHVAASRKMVLFPDEVRVAIEDWFCPSTLGNVQENRQVALVVWDPMSDVGYQVLGEIEKVEDIAVMNGYAPGIEDKSTMPQVERRFLVQVSKVIGFTHAPHSDMEE